MTAKLAETQLWQTNLASLIRSGLFLRAETGEFNGLFTVVGVYGDETCSAPMAKYSDSRRASGCREPREPACQSLAFPRVELSISSAAPIVHQAVHFVALKSTAFSSPVRMARCRVETGIPPDPFEPTRRAPPPACSPARPPSISPIQPHGPCWRKSGNRHYNSLQDPLSRCLGPRLSPGGGKLNLQG